MKYSNVKNIKAIGTRGHAKGVVFIAKRDNLDRYVLNKKTTSPSTGNITNRATSKTYVKTLTEAANLLATNNYLINVVSPDGIRALREHNKVVIECL